MTHALWLLRLAIPLLLAAPTMAAEVRPPALAPEPGPALIGSEGVPLRITGRVEPLGRFGFTHDWPGIYASARFEGDRVSILFDDADSRWQIRVDGGPREIVDRPGTQAVTLSGLGPGPHDLDMEKLSETAGAVIGVFIPAGERALPPPPPRRRQMEFIGDSDMVGFGVESPVRDCTRDEVRALTNTQLGFAPRVARAFDADYQVMARSGIGLVRNYLGANPGHEMPMVYRAAPPAGPDWNPGIVVIALGSNDFTDGVTDQMALIKTYEDGVIAFAAELQDRYPDSVLIFATAGDEYEFTDATRAALKRLDPARRNRATQVVFPERALTGCYDHPSLADQATMAKTITDWIETNPEIWHANDTRP